MARKRLVALVCGVGLACWVGAECVAQDWSPPVSQRDRDIAAETGSRVGDFPDAVLNGEPGSQDTCSVTVRAMKAGSMTPIVSGFKVTADAVSEQGHAMVTGKLTVTGGPKGSWAIRNAPPRFQVSDFFGNAGGGRGVISRRCWGAVSTVLLVVHDPQNLGKGADWVWDKNGKYAVE
jgi:hypothetical protein